MSKNIFNKINFIKFSFLILISVFFISISYAQTSTTVQITNFSEIGSLITNFNKNVIQNIVVLLGGAALVVFLWGMILFIYHRQNAKIDEKDKDMMLWGLIGLFVFVSVWGIIKLFQGFLGVEGTGNITLPTICVNGSCNAGSTAADGSGVSGGGNFNDVNSKLTTVVIVDAASVTKWNLANNAFAKGASGNEVAQLQKFLKDKGYDIGSTGIDSKFGDKTESAVKAFQTANKLEADGKIGFSTRAVILYRYLNATPATDPYNAKSWASDLSVNQGSEPDITNLQKFLLENSCYTGIVDGDFGSNTETAVKLYQYKNYLIQDGIVGPSTRSVILASDTFGC